MPDLGRTSVYSGWVYSAYDRKHGAWGPNYVLSVAAKFLSMTIHSCTVANDGQGNKVRMGIYKLVDGVQTAVLKGQTAIINTNTTPDWRTAAFASPPIITPGSLVFSLLVGCLNGQRVTVEYSGVNAWRYGVPDDWVDGLDDPFGAGYTDEDLSAESSFYATYEEVKLGGDEGMGARAVLPILARREPLSFPPRLKFPRLHPLRV